MRGQLLVMHVVEIPTEPAMMELQYAAAEYYEKRSMSASRLGNMSGKYCARRVKNAN